MPKKPFSWIKEQLEKHKLKIAYCRDFFFIVTAYGLLLSFSLSTLFPKILFNLKFIYAFGILFYFLKEELPRVIVKSQIKSK